MGPADGRRFPQDHPFCGPRHGELLILRFGFKDAAFSVGENDPVQSDAIVSASNMSGTKPVSPGVGMKQSEQAGRFGKAVRSFQ
jgi:hypothetical protein